MNGAIPRKNGKITPPFFLPLLLFLGVHPVFAMERQVLNQPIIGDYPVSFSRNQNIIAFNEDNSVFVKNVMNQEPPQKFLDTGFSVQFRSDGKEAVFVRIDEKTRTMDLWRRDNQSKEIKKLTNYGVISYAPAWSADNHEIAFLSNKDGDLALWKISINRPDRPKKLCRISSEFNIENSIQLNLSWSPDGRKIVFVMPGKDPRKMNLYLVDADGSKTPVPLTKIDGLISTVDWSPDGKRILFCSNHHGSFNMFYLELATGAIEAVDKKAGGNFSPFWSSDGTKIVYITQNTLWIRDFLIDEKGHPSAKIEGPVLNEVTGGTIPIKGTVDGNLSVDGITILSKVIGYTVEYGEGTEPFQWTEIYTSNLSGTFKSRKIAEWHSGDLSGVYSLRLRVFGDNETQAEQTVILNLKNETPKK